MHIKEATNQHNVSKICLSHSFWPKGHIEIKGEKGGGGEDGNNFQKFPLLTLLSALDVWNTKGVKSSEKRELLQGE